MGRQPGFFVSKTRDVDPGDFAFVNAVQETADRHLRVHHVSRERLVPTKRTSSAQGSYLHYGDISVSPHVVPKGLMTLTFKFGALLHRSTPVLHSVLECFDATRWMANKKGAGIFTQLGVQLTKLVLLTERGIPVLQSELQFQMIG